MFIENVSPQTLQSRRDGMFIENVSPHTLQSRRDGMFIDNVSPHTLQSRRDGMFIENVPHKLFSPVGTICLSSDAVHTGLNTVPTTLLNTKIGTCVEQVPILIG